MDKMIELSIGTRFYYKGRLCEVVELEDEYDRCSKCGLFIYDCRMMNCRSTLREDGKNVCFKWIKE